MAEGDRFNCNLCKGVTGELQESWNEARKQPYFAKKSADHMEWDMISRRAKLWLEKFYAMQLEVEKMLEDDRFGYEGKFLAMCESKAQDSDYDPNDHGWLVKIDKAWRKEQFDEANWYAGLMKALITNINGFYNQALNKIAADISQVSYKENANWVLIDTQELAMHDHAFDCWMAIRGVVYDFSYMTPHHPNKHAFVKECGKDVSSRFEDLQHDKSELNHLSKRIMGAYRKSSPSDGTGASLTEQVYPIEALDVANMTTLMQIEEVPSVDTKVLPQMKRLRPWHDFAAELAVQVARERRSEQQLAELLGSASLLATQEGHGDEEASFDWNIEFLEREAIQWKS